MKHGRKEGREGGREGEGKTPPCSQGASPGGGSPCFAFLGVLYPHPLGCGQSACYLPGSPMQAELGHQLWAPPGQVSVKVISLKVILRHLQCGHGALAFPKAVFTQRLFLVLLLLCPPPHDRRGREGGTKEI